MDINNFNGAGLAIALLMYFIEEYGGYIFAAVGIVLLLTYYLRYHKTKSYNKTGLTIIILTTFLPSILLFLNLAYQSYQNKQYVNNTFSSVNFSPNLTPKNLPSGYARLSTSAFGLIGEDAPHIEIEYIKGTDTNAVILKEYRASGVIRNGNSCNFYQFGTLESVPCTLYQTTPSGNQVFIENDNAYPRHYICSVNGILYDWVSRGTSTDNFSQNDITTFIDHENIIPQSQIRTYFQFE